MSIIVDERLARRFWPDGDPIGRRMFRPATPSEMLPNEKTRWLTVVGVVRDAQLRGPAIRRGVRPERSYLPLRGHRAA
jgi:hypothetical protein